ncbi:hypothetical protein SDC9_88475 [bioreactor metagenome]|uniref:Uncharacterized protein n=1 Tax=bioreactor metagenome TaxID=1076179 RepID=A0A644ZLQ0_9ZZZZ
MSNSFTESSAKYAVEQDHKNKSANPEIRYLIFKLMFKRCVTANTVPLENLKIFSFVYQMLHL